VQDKASTMSRDNSLANDFESLKSDFARLSGDVARLTKSLLDEGKQRGSSAREKIGTHAQRTMSQVGEGVEKVKAAGKTGADKLETQIKDHPLASVGVAFGIGVIIGQLLRR